MKNKLKKIISAALTCAMIFTTTVALNVSAYADGTSISEAASKPYTVKGKKVDMYFLDPSYKTTSSVYFVNGTDIPYMKLSDLLRYLVKMMNASYFPDYKISIKTDGDKVILTRENGYSCTIDFAKDTIYFYDYNAFRMFSSEHAIVELAYMQTKDKDGKDIYLQRLKSDTYERYGAEITMDLASYNIDLVRKGNKYYMPIQTFNDIFLWKLNYSILFNGKSLFFASPDNMLDSNNKRTELGKLYFKNSLKKETLSNELTEFNYNELCFALDHNYGLKEIHNIDNFDTLMHNTGLKQKMLSGKSESIDQAIYLLATRYLDDIHTKYGMPSPATGYKFKGKTLKESGEGPSRDAYYELMIEFKSARAKFYPDGVPAYEEIGDTAFITFDEFVTMGKGVDYYKKAPTADAKDTMGIIAYSVQKILRKNSPIKNVVLDLSCNNGGAADAAFYTIGAFLGMTSLSLEDSFTGALVTSAYAVDTNFDHEFDSNDYLAGKGLNIYCLESGVSFSCGNLVPSMFKEKRGVSLIGETSGGGACSILWVSTATGASIRVSSPTRLSFIKNGSFYDIDRGAAPDYYLGKLDSYFDREQLVDYIHSLL